MKKLILSFVVFFGVIHSNLFSQNPLLINTPNYIKNVTIQTLPLGPDPLVDYHGQVAEFASTAFADADGNLKFFVVDGEIFNKDGILLGYLQSGSKGRSEVVIAPKPGNCDAFYVFAVKVDDALLGDKLYVTEIDFTEPIQIGSPIMGLVLSDPNPIVNTGFKQKNMHIALSPRRANGTFVLAVGHSQACSFFEISTSGVNQLGTNIFNTASGLNSLYENRGEMELHEFINSSGQINYKLAMPFQATLFVPPGGFFEKTGIWVVTVDENFNFISDVDYQYLQYPVGSILTPIIRGLEFTRDGSHIVVNHTTHPASYPTALDKIDLNAPPLSAISTFGFPNDIEFQNSQVERLTLAGSGLYMINGNHMGKLDFNTTTGTFSLNTNAFPATVNLSIMNSTVPQLVNMYLLPDNVDYFDYDNYYINGNDIECCLANSQFDKITYTNDVGGIWNNTTINPISGTIANEVTIREELRIKKGTSVAIQNMTIKFAPGARLVIEEGDATTDGGLLELVNTKLTVDEGCATDQLWEGVEVRGISTQTQGINPSFMHSKQGRLNMFSNSTIEHAKIGATNYKRDPLSPITNYIVLGSQGGVIYALNSNFTNNKIDVEFDRYISPAEVNDFSAFTDCKFFTTDYIKDGSNPIGHIRMTRTRGVKVVGCEFENTATSPYTDINRGIGIWSRQASLIVTAGCVTFSGPTCTDWNNPNIFKNLHTGIHAYSSTSAQSLKSDRNVFINNRTGIYMASTSNAQVSRNKFIIEEVAGVNSYGVYMLDGNTHFLVDENSFTVELPQLNTAETYGVWTKGSGIENNMIYKNMIEFTKFGCYASSTNANPSILSTGGSYGAGLQYRCNTFRTSKYDIFLQNGSLRQTQGSSASFPTTSMSGNQSAANNIFTLGADPTSTYHDFNIEGLFNPIPLRYYHVSGLQQTPNSFVVGTLQPAPIFASGGTPIIFNSAIGCPSRLEPIGTSSLDVIISQKESEIIALKNLINTGASQTIIDDINSGSINTKLSSVLAVSPYASDDVLLAYLNRNPSNGHIQQVILANSPVSSVVMAKINSMSIPNGIKNQINNAQTGLATPIELVYEKLNNAQFAIESAVDTKIREIVFDETNTKTLSDLKAVVSVRPEKFYKQYTINVDIVRGDVVSAQNEISDLGTYARTQEINQIELGINSANSTIEYFDQNPSAVNTLIDIKNDSLQYCVCSGRAEAILYELENRLGDQFGYNNNPVSSAMTVNPIFNENESSNDKSTLSENSTIYPNPAETDITVTNLDVEEGTIFILDLTGKVLISDKINESNKFTIESLKSGAYILQIRDVNNQVVQTEQFFKK